MIHDITVTVLDTHYTKDGITETTYTETIPNAIDTIDVYVDALRNISLIYTYDLSCGYYIDSLIYSGNSAYMVCKSYTDQSDYHILAIAKQKKTELETIMKNLQNVIYESGYINA